MNIVEYDALLSAADWHYHRSDDPTEYRRGKASMAALGRIDEESPEHLALLTAWRNCAHSPLPRDQARFIRDATRRELGVLA